MVAAVEGAWIEGGGFKLSVPVDKQPEQPEQLGGGGGGAFRYVAATGPNLDGARR